MAATADRVSGGTVQTKLHDNLVEVGSLTRRLLECLSGSGKPDPDMKVTREVLQKLIVRDKEIQELASTAMEMCFCQHELENVETELQQRKEHVRQLQDNLQEAERIIELAVYKGHQKLDSISKAEKGAVSPEDLIQYSHHISQASSVISPVGWQISDPRRPFPQDIEMRCGVLGALTEGEKPHPQPNSTQEEGPAERDVKPPPEKKFAMAGMNQNLNNHEQSGTQRAPLPASLPMAPPVLADAEIMSEDSSPSSDEGT